MLALESIRLQWTGKKQRPQIKVNCGSDLQTFFPHFWLHRNQSIKTYLNLTAVWFGIFRNQAAQRGNTEPFPHRVKIPALQWRQPWSCCFYWVPRNWPWKNDELITDNKQSVGREDTQRPMWRRKSSPSWGCILAVDDITRDLPGVDSKAWYLYTSSWPWAADTLPSSPLHLSVPFQLPQPVQQHRACLLPTFAENDLTLSQGHCSPEC